MGEACVLHACCRAPALPKVPVGGDAVMLQPQSGCCMCVCSRQYVAGKKRQEVAPAVDEAGPDPLDLTPSQRSACIHSTSKFSWNQATGCLRLAACLDSAPAAVTATCQALELVCALAQADGPGSCAPGYRPGQHTHRPRHARCAAHDLERSTRLISIPKRRATQ